MVKGCITYVIATVVLLCSTFVSAHNVIGGVYAIGNQIEGEIGFSNGDMANAGTQVIVLDAAGNELGRTETDDQGLFVFEATQAIDHIFHADLSSGHVIDLTLPAGELPDALKGASSKTTDIVSGTNGSRPSEANLPSDTELQLLIERAVAKQVKPLRQELAAFKEKASLQDMIGGIGYIIGLCGLGMWWRQRQQDKLTQGKGE